MVPRWRTGRRDPSSAQSGRIGSHRDPRFPLRVRAPLERTDAQLVAAACQGDLASFGQLYERHYRMAVGIARSRLQDPHLAEDAAQESFAIACRSLKTLRDPERFPQWLGTLCRRTALRISAARTHYIALPDGVDVPSPSPSSAPARTEINEALEQLDEVAREIVLLHYFSGLSYDEIARALDLSVPSIHGRLQRARRKLSQLLAPNTQEMKG
jgi:RNA polymerase sigma-70 factor, ECF subfamily